MVEDPTPGAFLLSTVHFFAAGLCGWRFVRERQARDSKAHAWLWILLAAPILMLGIHHSAGLGTALTNAARQQALDEGWYGARRGLQRPLVWGILGLGPGALAVLTWSIRTQWRRYLPVVLAFELLAGYATLQLISLHDVDVRMHSRWLGISLGAWLNAAGLALAMGAVYWSFAKRRRV